MAGKLGLLAAGLLIPIVLLAIPFAYQDHFDRQHRAIFERIPIGSSRARLVAIAGPPGAVTDGTRFVDPAYARSAAQRTPGCVEEYWYDSGLPFMPSRWSYCMDEDGAILDKYHWVSW